MISINLLIPTPLELWRAWKTKQVLDKMCVECRITTGGDGVWVEIRGSEYLKSPALVANRDNEIDRRGGYSSVVLYCPENLWEDDDSERDDEIKRRAERAAKKVAKIFKKLMRESAVSTDERT